MQNHTVIASGVIPQCVKKKRNKYKKRKTLIRKEPIANALR